MSNTVTTVTSQANPLAYLKAIATLVGTIATGLLAQFGPGGALGMWLTIALIVATAVSTWVVPNALVVPAVIETDTPGEVAVVEDEEGDDGLDYAESGGLPFPSDSDEPTLYSGDNDPHRL